MSDAAPSGGGLARYDARQTYDWNYEHAPGVAHLGEKSDRNLPGRRPAFRDEALPGEWTYAGLRAASPLGIAAGPLLNGRWILHYAALGFDILTYKTVRSRDRVCYPLPNLQSVAATTVDGSENEIAASEAMQGSWAVSFGMPSRAPDIWRADIEATRKALPQEKLLSVSVVASPGPEWTLEQLADDYALCARWAAESGADCVEANFSCPNVASSDGQLYQKSEAAAFVAQRIRNAIGRTPLLIKVGHVIERDLASKLVAAFSPHCQALAMVNCISAHVAGSDGKRMFDGERRGIAGPAIREACVTQAKMFHEAIARAGSALTLVGVGGIGSAADVKAFLAAGCTAVQLATAAMLEPEVGMGIKREMERPGC